MSSSNTTIDTTVTTTTNTSTTAETTPTFNPTIETRTSLVDVLQNYQCPFEAEPELLCDYYKTHTEGGVCPFGHRLVAFTSGIDLSELPSYFCVNHLLEDCIHPLTEGPVSGLVRCTDGLHLKAADMVDSRRLQEMLASEVLDADARSKERQQDVELIIYSLDEDLEAARSSASPLSADVSSSTTSTTDDCCSICRVDFASVAAFGLLDSCDHAFCAGCILTWRNSQNRCPNCRVGFARVLLWSRPKLPRSWSTEHKTALFELQSRCAGTSAGQRVRVDDLQEMMERLTTTAD